jgi:hypothetical protein
MRVFEMDQNTLEITQEQYGKLDSILASQMRNVTRGTTGYSYRDNCTGEIVKTGYQQHISFGGVKFITKKVFE